MKKINMINTTSSIGVKIDLCAVLFLLFCDFPHKFLDPARGSVIRRQLICEQLLLSIGDALQVSVGE